MTSPPAAGKRRSLINMPSSEDQQFTVIAEEVMCVLCHYLFYVDLQLID